MLQGHLRLGLRLRHGLRLRLHRCLYHLSLLHLLERRRIRQLRLRLRLLRRRLLLLLWRRRRLRLPGGGLCLSRLLPLLPLLATLPLALAALAATRRGTLLRHPLRRLLRRPLGRPLRLSALGVSAPRLLDRPAAGLRTGGQ